MCCQLGEPARVDDHAVAESEPEPAADHDRDEGDEGRLEQEAGLHHASAEADRAQNADLLAPLHDGAR
jgi:hypothetical protein